MMMTFRCVMGITLVTWALTAPCAARAETFGYFGKTGPAHWGELSPEWETCNKGEMQSPVDFRHFSSQRKFSIDYGSTKGEIFNNGHTIEVETNGNNTLTLDGTAYELAQIHFHTASEHIVKGRGFEMEMHLVHMSADGSIAVIGVFLKRGPGNGALAPLFESLPDDIGAHHPLEASFDPATFLPGSRKHYSYVGSLTTPPCTEGVQWIVMAEPVSVSDVDIAQFAERIHFNARPVQRQLK